MALFTAIPPVVVTVAAAVAFELRRLSEAQAAVAAQRSVASVARSSARR